MRNTALISIVSFITAFGLLFAGVTVVQAQQSSAADLQQRIQMLQRLVSNLQSQLEIRTQVNQRGNAVAAQAEPQCVDIPWNLDVGKSSQEVETLQEFLRSRGHFDYPQATGYFGSITKQAVQSFQEAQGIVSSGAPATTGYGRVGPRTRARIRALTCNNRTARKGTLALSNLKPLEKGFYEGWLIKDGEKTSTGKFKNPNNAVFDIPEDYANPQKVVVTIEPEDDTDEIPSGVVVLQGTVADNGMAMLSYPISLENAEGSYILATPTNGSNSSETSGVWFLEVPPPSSASLSLPTLPDNWVYEGWAVSDGKPITTGRFSSTTEPDNFAGFSGPQSGPPFPGEDFLRDAPNGVSFPLELADGNSKVVLTVEPDLNGVDPTGSKPFSIKLLADTVPADAADHTNYKLMDTGKPLPSGIASIQ